MAGPSQAFILDEAGAELPSSVDDDCPAAMESDAAAECADFPSHTAASRTAEADTADGEGRTAASRMAARMSASGMSASGMSARMASGRTAADRAAVLDELRAELAARPATATSPRAVPTLPALPGVGDLLPERGLRRGASYAVQGSTTLTMALLAGASRAGSWCGVVGLPGFGAEAADRIGVDLSRLVLVPAPGRSWLNVVATLVDVLDLVVVHPSAPAYDAETRRLAARLRERGAVLIVQDAEWSGCELRFAITSSSWHGLGHGHGHLTSREVTVEATGRGAGGRRRITRLWLPDHEGDIRTATGDRPSAAGDIHSATSDIGSVRESTSAANVLEFAAPEQWERAG